MSGTRPLTPAGSGPGTLGSVTCLRRCSLPYVPQPFPDEILGSWFARVRVISQPGTWKRFASAQTGRRNVHLPFFRMRNDSLSTLLSALGSSLEVARESMTIAPYWRRFLPTDASSFELKCQQLAAGVKDPSPRFCPACLEDDLRIFGASYWHREHQLPNVLGCRKHRVRLADRCAACSRLPAKASSTVIEPITVRCECGADLRRQGSELRAPSLYWEFVEFSASALHSPAKSLLGTQYSHVGSQLREQIPLEAALARLAPRGAILVASASYVSSRELCVLFAATSTKFEDAVMRYQRSAYIPDKQTRQSWCDLSHPELRRLLLCWCRLHPGLGPESAGRLYWRVRLLDVRWFESRFPSTRRAPVPSVALDRAEICTFLHAGRGSVMWIAAGLRAAVRDADWLRSLLNASRTQSLATRTRRRHEAVSSEIADSIRRLEDARPPVYITLPRIAQCLASGSSAAELGRLICRSPELELSIRRANETLQKRRLRWVAEDALASDLPLMPTAWAAKAHLPYSVGLANEMFTVAREMAAEGLLVGERWNG